MTEPYSASDPQPCHLRFQAARLTKLHGAVKPGRIPISRRILVMTEASVPTTSRLKLSICKMKSGANGARRDGGLRSHSVVPNKQQMKARAGCHQSRENGHPRHPPPFPGASQDRKSLSSRSCPAVPEGKHVRYLP